MVLYNKSKEMAESNISKRDRKEYAKKHYYDNYDKISVRKAWLYYSKKRDKIPGPHSVLGRWCASHNLDIQWVLDNGIPDSTKDSDHSHKGSTKSSTVLGTNV